MKQVTLHYELEEEMLFDESLSNDEIIVSQVEHANELQRVLQGVDDGRSQGQTWKCVGLLRMS